MQAKRILAFFPLFLLILSCNESRQNGEAVELKNKSLDLTIDKKLLNEITDSIHSGYYPNIHSMIIYKSGETIYENYFKGEDQKWGKEIGEVNFDRNTLHDVRSVSKSVVSACVGIAIDEGKIESVQQNIFDFFEDYNHLKNDQNQNLTIYHLLTMTSGFEWDESVPIYNTEGELEKSLNKIAFVLSRNMKNEPGTKFNYSGGNTELLSNIILRTTGKDVYQYAKEKIFNKIDIENSSWTNYTNTTSPASASGLRLTPRGLLKLGLLYLNGGKWKDEQVLSESWVNESLKTLVLIDESDNEKPGYGYHFWTWEYPVGDVNFHLAGASGNGGQQIYIDKKNEIILVFTAGNYNNWNLQVDTYSIFEKVYNAF